MDQEMGHELAAVEASVVQSQKMQRVQFRDRKQVEDSLKAAQAQLNLCQAEITRYKNIPAVSYLANAAELHNHDVYLGVKV